MNKILFGSIHPYVGKTSLIAGIIKSLGKKIGYMKPFGDRLFYHNKRLWDFDYVLMSSYFGLDNDPDFVTVGFDHSKIRFTYDTESIKKKLLDMANQIGQGKELLLLEGGKDIGYGVSLDLDCISICRNLNAKLVLILSGKESTVIDDLSFIKNFLNLNDISFAGAIINQVMDIDDFKTSYQSIIDNIGIPIIGLIPYQPDLTFFSARDFSDLLFAKVIAGEQGLDQKVENILVGAMSADAVLRYPPFQKENKLVITSGDRSDMILAAIESHTVCVVLTNNILPPANIISKADEKGIPLLLTSRDTFQIAKQIDDMEPHLTKDSPEKLELLSQLVATHIDLNALIK